MRINYVQISKHGYDGGDCVVEVETLSWLSLMVIGWLCCMEDISWNSQHVKGVQQLVLFYTIIASTKTPTMQIMSCLLYFFHDDDIVLLDETMQIIVTKN